MKKKCLCLFALLSFFWLGNNVRALEPECTRKAAMQLAKIVYHEVGSVYDVETGTTDDLFAQLTTASIVLNNASSRSGNNWYEKIYDLTDNNYSNYSRYKDIPFDEYVDSNYRGRMLYVAEVVLTGKYNVPKNIVFQAADYIVKKEGRTVWTYVEASPFDVYFGYSGNIISDKDVFGRNVQSKDVQWYKKTAKSFEKSSYDEYTINSLCSGMSSNIGDNDNVYIDIPVCENPDILKVIYFASIIFNIVKIIIPIGLIIMAMLDFSKGVTSNNEGDNKKNLSKLIKRLIYAVLIFAVPWIVKIVIINLGNLTKGVNYTDCLENANGDKINELEKEYSKKTGEAKDDSSSEKGSSNNYDMIVFVGDSRTYQMCFSVETEGNVNSCSYKSNGNKPFTTDNRYYIAEGSMGYSWFVETAIPAINSIVNSNEGRYAVVSLMGVNGLESDKFVSKYRELSNTHWSNNKYKIILISVMPVNDNNIKNYGNVVNNKNIEQFNNELKQLADSVNNITYCDIYTTMKSNMTLYKLRDDGLHYTSEAYKEIYKLMKEKCL